MDRAALENIVRNLIRQMQTDPVETVPADVPIGGAILWPGPQNKIPKGYVESNQTVKIDSYPMLFQKFGATYNSGTPAGSFRLPNYGTVADSATATVGRWIIRYG